MEETHTSGQEQVEEQAAGYELSLTGPGMMIKRTVDEDVALGVITMVMGGAPPEATAQSVPSSLGRSAAGVTVPRTSQAAPSVGEFLAETEAKRNPDKIVAFGIYLEDYAGKKPFTRDDIRSQFPRAGEGIPSNFARDFKWAVANKWIAAEHGSTEEFFITTTGRKAVAANFSDEFMKKTRLARGRRRTKGKDTGKDVVAESEAE